MLVARAELESFTPPLLSSLFYLFIGLRIFDIYFGLLVWLCWPWL